MILICRGKFFQGEIMFFFFWFTVKFLHGFFFFMHDISVGQGSFTAAHFLDHGLQSFENFLRKHKVVCRNFLSTQICSGATQSRIGFIGQSYH